MFIVMNPNNGPGTVKDPTYGTYVANMQGAGIKVLGYISTDYGDKNGPATGYSIADIEALVDDYYTWYNVDGIFLDAMDNTNSSTNAGYYSTLTTYIHGKKAGQLVVGDPGAMTVAVYIGTVDVIVGYTGAGLPSASSLQAVTTGIGGTASQWAMIAYAQSTAPTVSYINNTTNGIELYVSWIFVTDASNSNKFTQVPSYQSTELANLQTMDAPGGGGGSGGGGSQYVPPASTTGTHGKYTVKIAGSEVDLWESIDFDNSLDLKVNKAQIQFPDSSSLLASEGIGQDVQILRDGVPIWRGLGVSNQKIYDSKGKKQYNLNCLSNKIYLQNAIFTKPPGGSPVVTYGGSIGLVTQPAQQPLTSAVSIFNDILASQGGAGASTPSVGYIMPFYMYPGSVWTDLINAKKANPSVPMIAIINPDNGPVESYSGGLNPDPTYQSYVSQLHAVGITVIGYVATNYAQHNGYTVSTANAEGQIDDYYNWYNVDGIFFDEMDYYNDSGSVTYYQTLTTYVHGKKANQITIGNPGTATLAMYVANGCADIITPYEGSGNPLPSGPTINSLTTALGGTAADWGIFVYAQSTAPTQSYITSLVGDIAWIYCTDAVLPNPYNTESSYYLTTIQKPAAAGGSSTSPGVLRAGALGTTNVPHADLIITRQTAIQTLSELISASLWEARVNPDNSVDFGSNAIGTVGSLTSVFTFQEEENLMQTEIDYGIDKLVNQVIICGNGSASVSPPTQISVTAKNSSSITANGTWSKILTLSNVVDQNLLQAYANALLDDLNSPIYTVSVELVDSAPGVPFQMGDYVTVNEPSFNLNNAAFRVISEHRHYDSQQGEVANIILAQNYRMVNATHFRLKRLEDILNSQMQNQQVFNNSYNQSPTQNFGSVNLPSNSTYIVNGQTVSVYGVVSSSGIFSSCSVVVAALLIGGSMTNETLTVSIIDLFTGQTIISNAAASIGTNQYTFTNPDVTDHVLQVELSIAGSGTATVELNGGSISITSTPPA